MPEAVDATTVVEDYFARLEAAATAAGARIGRDELAELRAHVAERLGATSGAASDATAVLAELGSPVSLARAFADAAASDEGHPGAGGRRQGALVGRVLGMPYDVRPPSSERSAIRVWDPRDPRIIVPKPLGIGWTINFAAIAVKARLVRPDDEDEAFATVPERVVTASLAAPVAVLVGFVTLAVAAWSELPARVPTHWGVNGQADGFASPAVAMGGLVALAVVPALLAVGTHLRRRRPFYRVAASAISLGFVVLSVGMLWQTRFTLDGGSGVWPTWIGIAGFALAPFLLLVGVSRLGTAAEQRRDIYEQREDQK